jgi:hypothetical protein
VFKSGANSIRPSGIHHSRSESSMFKVSNGLSVGLKWSGSAPTDRSRASILEFGYRVEARSVSSKGISGLVGLSGVIWALSSGYSVASYIP